jgi:DNA-binding NarL/FixJ family response regulator
VTKRIGLVLSDDLLFASKITAEAHAAGCDAVLVRSLDALTERFAASPLACVFVDLGFPGLAIGALASRLHEVAPSPRIVAYGSHVDAETLRAAREAGCTAVLTRSQFAEHLAQRLPDWLDGLPAANAATST